MKLKRPPLYEQAYEALIAMIADGTLQPGQRVTEKSLADQLGVSSTPVREAMRKLEHDGLVEGNSNAFQILAITANDVEQLYVCREALEVLALEAAVERLDADDLDELEVTLAAAEQAAREGDFLKLVGINSSFHDRILQATGNRWLVLTVSFVRRPLLLTRLRITFDQVELPRILSDHRAILDTLRRRDGVGAANAMHQHMTADRNRMLRDLIRLERQGAP